ncbi:DUF2793 domain-containing protein [Hyphomicrobium sp.]|uniref:DUF2793 domain-containing protein n=1 Tax=Hyphomicrobium sp. TaxID=82 RepID=UPI000FA0DF8F|nr:DUF2793 domain-containing protein [Hyphomicrobium sp.]RUO97834.1 MAG: DUF2793 domain-containing protein [Hyphomicrobium sp.]
MNDTPNLALPYILASQAQKHVTHNEAIRALDCLVQLGVESRTLTSPPTSPADGDRYIVATAATGAWTGAAGKIAGFQDGAWMFYDPQEGWIAWVADHHELVVYSAGAWAPFTSGGGSGGGLTSPVANSDLADMANGTIKGRKTAGSGKPEDLSASEARAVLGLGSASTQASTDFDAAGAATSAVAAHVAASDPHTQYHTNARGDARYTPIAPTTFGVNATADATNRFSLKALASLFDNVGNGHQQKINKAAAGDTASVLYQTNYSGRAEMGLTGDDDFHFKVSADGSTWFEALKIARGSGKVSFPSWGGPREVLAANRTYYIRTDGSDSNDGLANASGRAFLTIQKALNLAKTIDLNGFVITVQIADGTYTGANSLDTPLLGGSVIIQGNSTTPANVLISVTSADAFSINGAGIKATIKDLKIQTSSGGNGIYAKNAAEVNYANVVFGPCAERHVRADSNAHVQATGNYTIAGNALDHLLSFGGNYEAAGITITLSGAPAFSGQGFNLDFLGRASLYAVSFSGSATGKRYNVSANSVLQSFGAGSASTYFPGNANGTTSTGGQQL